MQRPARSPMRKHEPPPARRSVTPRPLSTALAALAVTLALAAPAAAAPSGCGPSGYAYAGFLAPAQAFGVSGRLTIVTPGRIESGHVAAWIGFGGSGLGPGGSDAWIQAGISGYPDGRRELYYEFQLPGQPQPRYVTLGRAVPGVGYDFAVYERPSQPNAWRVVLTGQKVSPPILLPGSHGAWRPVATGESWDGGTPACNRFNYDFAALAIATQVGGGWQPFPLSRPIQDAGYRVQPRVSGFAASATG